MPFNTKMTAINNEIRDLSGATGLLGLDAMASNLSEVNAEVNNQAELIAQIQTALQNKASGSVEPVLQSKTVTHTSITKSVTPDSGFDGLSEDSEILNSIFNGTISSYSNSMVSILRHGIFMNCTNLSYTSLPSCSLINDYAFQNCTNLTNANFPICSSIRDYGFYACTNLEEISFPKCKVVGSQAFAKCSKLTEIDLPQCTTVFVSAFASCKSVTSINLQNCTSVYNYAFNTCENLTDVSLPSCNNILNSAFSNCYSLSTISLPAISDMRAGVFNKCYNLKSLYLMGSTLCKLSNSNVFASTPIGGYSASAGTYGSIYVPASMLASYQTATNWTYFSNRMVGI